MEPVQCFRILCLTFALSAQLAASFPQVRTTFVLRVHLYSRLKLFRQKNLPQLSFFLNWSHWCIDRQRCPRSTVSTAKDVKCVLRVRKALSLFVFLHLVNLVVFPSSLDSPFNVNERQRKLHWKKLFCKYCSLISWEKHQTNLQSESVA